MIHAKLFIGITFLSALLMGGCGLLGGGDENKNIPQELVPLETGNYWLYHRWFSELTIADTIREEVLSRHDITIQGEAYTVFGYQRTVHSNDDLQVNKGARQLDRTENSLMYEYSFSFPDYQWLRANSDEGLYSFGGIAPSDTLILKTLHYQYPGKAGDTHPLITLSYSFQEQIFSIRDTTSIEITGINENFESEFASYEGCYVYSFSEMGSGDALYWWDHFIYIKPGVGIVAVVTRDRGSSNHEIIGQWILIDHHSEN